MKLHTLDSLAQLPRDVSHLFHVIRLIIVVFLKHDTQSVTTHAYIHLHNDHFPRVTELRGIHLT